MLQCADEILPLTARNFALLCQDKARGVEMACVYGDIDIHACACAYEWERTLGSLLIPNMDIGSDQQY